MARRDQMPRVAVMGGSLGGLTAALVLRDIGCDVDVYERSTAALEGRGAGIVVHDMTVRYFARHGILDIDEVSTSAPYHRYLDPNGGVAWQAERGYRFTAYNTIWRALLGCFDARRYHFGHEIVAFDEDDGVAFRFANGDAGECDLLVCADGIASTARSQLFPGMRPQYAGYVAWRGVVDERDLTPDAYDALWDAITYCVIPESHILVYPIPNVDGSLQPGQRLANFVWYRNVDSGPELRELMTDRDGRLHDSSLPPGQVADRYVNDLRATAAAELPEPIAEVVLRTTEPFIQVIFDIGVPCMTSGRVCLVGDAAFAVRPHTAAATAKAAADGWALADALEAAAGDVDAALARWEPQQVALGRQLLERARDIGDRSQFKGTWTPGDPSLAFGLYGPGQ